MSAETYNAALKSAYSADDIRRELAAIMRAIPSSLRTLNWDSLPSGSGTWNVGGSSATATINGNIIALQIVAQKSASPTSNDGTIVLDEATANTGASIAMQRQSDDAVRNVIGAEYAGVAGAFYNVTGQDSGMWKGLIDRFDGFSFSPYRCAPGSVTVPTDSYAIMADHLTLGASDVLTLTGTAVLAVI